ncbi:MULTISPECIES: hypothetical protein [unclassified Paraburkholderia]|uniref:hypothetical protein n=1 Tax=unclassified Paraburkholderia TaxID=2615204 RepID=UPI002AB151F5|nr:MULTISPECIES: hypothetical protein [unclassified Paraburkholderia]
MQTDLITVSLRESRMVLERLMQVTRVDEGLVPALRDCALYSTALCEDGFIHLTKHLGQLSNNQAAGVSIDVTDEGATRVRCAGQHAWPVALTLVDLAVDAVRAGREARFVVEDASEADELRVAMALAQPYGLEATLEVKDNARHVTFRAASTPAESTLARIVRKGLSVERAYWWALFHRANDALAPDSYESRRHAGPIIVDEQGRVIGRTDEDETDLSMLYTGAPSTQENKEISC